MSLFFDEYAAKAQFADPGSCINPAPAKPVPSPHQVGTFILQNHKPPKFAA